ncbi:MAG: hypothetical protein Q9M25_08570 [Mariprofundaceae bacterium]|nr:hypothetical protein [Mariprofundaceae bacterium]
MKKICVIAGSFLMLAMIGSIFELAIAADSMQNMHGHQTNGTLHVEKHSPCAMKASLRMSGEMVGMEKGKFITKTEVDGYTVIFRVMEAKEGMAQGATHHLMIKVEKNGAVVTDLVANSKASHPNDQSESKMMMKMGDWYMAAYDLGHQGLHELTVLFKTADGVKHYTSVKLPAQ